MHLFERERVGIDLWKRVWHVVEYRDGASTRAAKQRGCCDAEGMLSCRSCVYTGNSHVLWQFSFWEGGCIKLRQRKCWV